MPTTRRQFLITGLGITASIPIAAGVPKFLRTPVDKDSRVLVVIQLSGGNDGLNTVIPRTQDAYYRLRPTLAIGSKAVKPISAAYGLHPSMGGLADVFDQQKLAIIHGVGHGYAERSHFRSMEIWHTASAELPLPDEGWLGHLADQISAKSPGSMPALHIGSGVLPLALRGRAQVPPTVRDPKGFQLKPNHPDFASARAQLLNSGTASGELDFLRRAADSTYEATDRMSQLGESQSSAAYPSTELGRQLKLVARLIAGRFGTRIFQVELGGFDHHSRQGPAHQALLRQLSEAMTAFQADLASSGHEDRVLTFAFSEFGRRAAENGSRGTDHGAGAPAFLMGARVRHGFHGTAPDLSRLVSGDVAVTTDFRSVYTTLEETWMGLLPSTNTAPLPLV